MGSDWGGEGLPALPPQTPPHPGVYEGLRPSNSPGWEKPTKPAKPPTNQPNNRKGFCSRPFAPLKVRANLT